MSECSGSCAVQKQSSLISMFTPKANSVRQDTPAIFNDFNMQNGFDRYADLKPTICYFA